VIPLQHDRPWAPSLLSSARPSAPESRLRNDPRAVEHDRHAPADQRDVRASPTFRRRSTRSDSDQQTVDRTETARGSPSVWLRWSLRLHLVTPAQIHAAVARGGYFTSTCSLKSVYTASRHQIRPALAFESTPFTRSTGSCRPPCAARQIRAVEQPHHGTHIESPGAGRARARR